MSSENIQDLLKKGIEAAREGNKAEARAFFEQVVEQDEKNERGWFWLASVVESEDEKRICLKNVLQINPSNERAQKLMEQLESRQRKSRSDEEVIPGITRRQATLAVVGIAALVIVAVVVVFGVTSSRNAQVAQETQAARQVVALQTEGALTQTAIAVQGTETQAARVSPTPTITPTREFELPPTFTPTPTQAEVFGPTPLPPPPPGLGTIIGWGGRDVSQIDFLPLRLYPIGGQPSVITEEAGSDVDISADGMMLVYTRYFPATFDFNISQLTLSGGDNEPLVQGLALLKSKMPYFCASNPRLVSFVALPNTGSQIDLSGSTVQSFQVYTLDINTNVFNRLTNDQAVYTYPAISPDCTRIAAIRNDARGAAPGEDLVVIDTATLAVTPITTDLGNFVESSPRWSPDGLTLAYAAYQATTPGSSDILVRPADGSGTPLVPIRDAADDRSPVFSPDGRYIAFASNRTGFYDIFIYDQVDQTTYQLTNTEEEDYPGAWKP